MEKPNENLPKTPMTDILDSEVKDYVEARFPLTNDDNLRENFSYKIITENDFLDKIYENYLSGQLTAIALYKKLNEMYDSYLEAKEYVDANKDFFDKINKMLNELGILKRFRDEANFENSTEEKEISANKMLIERINEIEQELDRIPQSDIKNAEHFNTVSYECVNLGEKYLQLYKMLCDEEFDVSQN